MSRVMWDRYKIELSVDEKKDWFYHMVIDEGGNFKHICANTEQACINDALDYYISELKTKDAEIKQLKTQINVITDYLLKNNLVETDWLKNPSGESACEMIIRQNKGLREENKFKTEALDKIIRILSPLDGEVMTQFHFAKDIAKQALGGE